ncbi:uncharacterized protein si:dkey-37g12.1 [Electrophorus electricus]|uniref:uncharacterized protein si:dkey-37g12.1 n=1 Tax=Electrophorus electricus TaxID=8005 RepID=UPI0015CFEC89|nr:uncharacterized protein si:dkey-37g12.1 [Electrophorus electricus]
MTSFNQRILDDLLSRLELYACNLEEVVREQKQAEGLLTQMLPRSEHPCGHFYQIHAGHVQDVPVPAKSRRACRGASWKPYPCTRVSFFISSSSSPPLTCSSCSLITSSAENVR